jgi:hypothetical protein
MSTKKKTTRRLVPLRSIATRLEKAAKMLNSSARDLKAHATKGVKPSKTTKAKAKAKPKAKSMSGVKGRKGVRVAYKRAA